MSQKKILLVEDEKNIRDILKDNLEYEGYTILEAEDGLKGLEIAKNENPDLIILDLMLPQMHGYDFIKQLKKTNPTIPIIIVSAKSEEIDKIKGLDLGADDYITKPFQI
ncbi:MAG TPA: response regulator, partial [Exilispira sp.]|nr:response regulator [Exilispira sp.]